MRDDYERRHATLYQCHGGSAGQAELGNASTGFEAIDKELVFLQLRKILELLAFASLTANREKYAAAHKKFATFWRAKDMLQDLEKVNPDFYPRPVQPP